MLAYHTFESSHLEKASQLLAERHQQDVLQQSFLPNRFITTEHAKQAIKTILDKEHTSGYIACEGDEMVSYMLGTLIEQDYLGDNSQGWVYLPSYAFGNQRHIAELYARIADEWVKRACYHHFTLVPAHAHDLQDTWFSLSFGREQAHGALDLSQFKREPRPISLNIRLATADDEVHFRTMSNWISRYQVWTPTFAPITQDYLSNQTNSFANLIDDNDATIFLAFRYDALVGYHLYYDVEDDAGDMMHDPQATELVVAATHPDYRGQGIGRQLADYAFHQMHKRGYQTCVTDWRTTNRASSYFWQQMGFVPTHYRLVRRLDERIEMIYKELYT